MSTPANPVAHSKPTDIQLDPERGQQGKSCFTVSCQKPKSATNYNVVTKHYYCDACAEKMQERADRQGNGLTLFGEPHDA